MRVWFHLHFDGHKYFAEQQLTTPHGIQYSSQKKSSVMHPFSTSRWKEFHWQCVISLSCWALPRVYLVKFKAFLCIKPILKQSRNDRIKRIILVGLILRLPIIFLNILTNQKQDITGLKLLWPVNMTGRGLIIILSLASLPHLLQFTQSNPLVNSLESTRSANILNFYAFYV